MVSHDQAVEIIRDTIDRDDRIPDRMSYIIHEADTEGAHANVSLPLIEFQILDTSRDDLNNSNLTDFVFNSNGEKVGRIFELKWEMQLQMNVWTVGGSDHDADTLGQVLRTVLYDYDTLGPDETFQDERGEPVQDIWNFKLQNGERADDLTQTPTIRRFRQSAEVSGAEQYRQEGLDPIQEVV
jgi:hypothetical protein